VLTVPTPGANKADIPLTFWDYRHHALVATIRTEEPHGGVARQIFHNDGILAFLPLADPHLCSVWSLVPEKAQQMQEATPEAFNQALCVAFDNRLGLCTLESERQVFPLTGATRVSLRRTVWRWWGMRRIPFIRWPGRALTLALWTRRSWLKSCVACIAKAKISVSICTCVATSAAASTVRR
jgi:hypothetical protein